MNIMNLEEYKGVYVFAEQVDNKLSGIAFELLGKAKDLAADLNAEVAAVLIGSDVKGLADELAAYGADKAVDRRFKRDGEQTADFINCVVFGKSAEFTERYFRQGMRVVVCGRIQTGSYTNRDGVKVYTTEVVVEEQEFAESKNASSANTQSYQTAPAPAPSADAGDGFMNIPDGIDEELPFN